MSFNAQDYLDQHDGDALAALAALEAQRAQAQAGRDTEGQSALRARRERDEARSRAKELETAQASLTAYEKLGTPEDLTAKLASLASLTDAVSQAGLSGDDLAASLTARLERAAAADELERQVLLGRAASANQVSEADLTEWLGGRSLVADGDAYGIRVPGDDGEVFRPLTEFATFAKLATPSQVAPTWTRQDVQPQPSTTAAQREATLAASGQYIL